jgi:hypothetical protein
MAKPMTLSGVWRRFLNLVILSQAEEKVIQRKIFSLVFFFLFFLSEKRDVIVMMTLASYLASFNNFRNF